MRNILFLVVTIVAFGCSKDDEVQSEQTFTITGKIVSVTETPLASVTVNFYRLSEPDSIKTSITNDKGVFTLSLKNGDYNMEVIGNGYNIFNDFITVSLDDSLSISISGKASVSGRVIDSQTGRGLADAKISFARQNNPEVTLVTNDSGRFEISGMPVGDFLMAVEKEAFFTRRVENVSLHEGLNELPDAVAVDKPNTGEVRIVLSWGEYPFDLDSHLTGSIDEGTDNKFHMYWNNKDPNEYVSLDVDDIVSYGPETTTISHLFFPTRTDGSGGSYVFSVHNYSPTDPSASAVEIFESHAVVELYDASGLIRTFIPSSVPAGYENRNIWFVFRLMESDYSPFFQIVDYGYWYQSVPFNQEGDSQYFRKSGGKKDIYDFRNF